MCVCTCTCVCVCARVCVRVRVCMCLRARLGGVKKGVVPVRLLCALRDQSHRRHCCDRKSCDGDHSCGHHRSFVCHSSSGDDSDHVSRRLQRMSDSGPNPFLLPPVLTRRKEERVGARGSRKGRTISTAVVVITACGITLVLPLVLLHLLLAAQVATAAAASTDAGDDNASPHEPSAACHSSRCKHGGGR